MAWNIEIPLLLRSYIGDISTTPTYSDDDLAKFTILAATLVTFDVSLKRSYYIDPVLQVFNPDPTDRIDAGILDTDFITLIIARAGAIIFNNEVRLYGSQSILVKDSFTTIDARRDLKSLLALAESYDKKYGLLKQNYIRGDGNLGLAIMSSSTSNPYAYGPLSTEFSDFLRCYTGESEGFFIW